MNQPPESPGPDAPDGPYRFTGLIATAWRFYTARFFSLVGLFVLISAVVMGLQFVLILEMPDQARIMVGLFTIIALPAIGWSFGFGVLSGVLDRYLTDEEGGVKETLAAGKGNRRNMTATAFLAGIMALTAVTVLGPLGSILVPLFLGPPMIMQVVALEGVTLAEGWARARETMRGHWARVIAYLLSISLGIGMINSAAITATGGALGESDDIATAAIYILVTVLTIGLTYPYLGAAQFVAYADIASLDEPIASPRRTRADEATTPVTDGEPTEDGLPGDHYEALGISRDATQKQVRRAYQTRVKLLDPARHDDADPATQERLESSRQRAEEAYYVLSDPDRRAVYDQELA